jgi:hypothetical protein
MRPKFMPAAISVMVSLCALVAAGVIGLDVWRRAARMQPSQTPAAVVAGALVGADIKAVVRLDALTDLGIYSGRMLESRSGSGFHATTTLVRLAALPDATVVMGGAKDVRTGAIVQVEGQFDARRVLRVRRFVVLTGFIRPSDP